MPPHCDSLDGPVVTAARQALDAGSVHLVLPFVPAAAEPELSAAFAKASEARKAGGRAKEVADHWFFETAVRLHRAGEGAPFTGVKPAGLGFGPVVPLAEKALASGALVPLYKELNQELHTALHHRFEAVQALQGFEPADVAAARAYVSASLSFQVWAHGVHEAIAKGASHGAGAGGHQH